VIWRWYWCATTDRILDENMQAIEVEFFLNDEDITSRFGERTFPFTEKPMKGWSCFTYEAVLKDWNPGGYSLRQQTTLLDEVNDGAETFPAGYKIYSYTVTVP
jgi:hypothetical protein